MTEATTDRGRAPSTDSPVLAPGRNCWTCEQASRIATLVDTEDYFSAFAQACRAAERQILILGWDFEWSFAWMVVFFILTMVVALVLRKPMGVEL